MIILGNISLRRS